MAQSKLDKIIGKILENPLIAILLLLVFIFVSVIGYQILGIWGLGIFPGVLLLYKILKRSDVKKQTQIVVTLMFGFSAVVAFQLFGTIGLGMIPVGFIFYKFLARGGFKDTQNSCEDMDKKCRSNSIKKDYKVDTLDENYTDMIEKSEFTPLTTIITDEEINDLTKKDK